MEALLAIAFLAVGLALGSFLNVCISRLPRDLSVVAPRSYCPSCRAPIAWRDNIPLLSWMILRGRCRACGGRISPRYPVVELLTAVLFVACYASFGLTAMALKACVLCFLLVGLIFMDAETGLLPAEFTYSGILLGFLFAWFVPVDSSGIVLWLQALGSHAEPSGALLSLLDAALAVLFGAGFFFVAWAVYFLVRKRDGLGFGDIALMAMVAVFLGLKLTVLVVFLAPVSATIYAIVMLVARPKAAGDSPQTSVLFLAIPFGVFLGASGFAALFFGESIWRWYLGFFQ